MSGWTEVGMNPAMETRLKVAFEEAVTGSFAFDGGRMTQREVMRRCLILNGVMKMLRHDMKWSFHRIMDELPRALRCMLDGISYEPSKRSHWRVRDRGELSN